MMNATGLKDGGMNSKVEQLAYYVIFGEGVGQASWSRSGETSMART